MNSHYRSVLMKTLRELASEIKDTRLYFDKTVFRMSQRLSNAEMAFLRSNASSANQRRGHHIRNSANSLALRVVVPNTKAIWFIDEIDGVECNYVEAAREHIMRDALSAEALIFAAAQTIVQRWHGKQQLVVLDQGFYTGQRRAGHRLAGYTGKPSKIVDAAHVAKLEGIHQGKPAVERLGILRPRDLLTFDHVGYWDTHYQFFTVDRTKLGRFHQNRISGLKRRAPRYLECDGFRYDIDGSTGSVLWRVYAAHERQQYRSVQTFIDRYGRGPFLVPALPRLHSLIYDNQSFDPEVPIPSTFPDQQED